MDTLMDCLAQKLNAQEMIRANGEAETEQMNFLKTQVNQYQGCLDRMQQVCTDLGNLEQQINTLALPQANAYEESISDIKEQIEKLQADLLDKVSTEENVHKEGVRLYKNVQAAVTDSEENVVEEIKVAKKAIKSSVNGVKAIAIIAVVLSAASLTMQILSLMGII